MGYLIYLSNLLNHLDVSKIVVAISEVGEAHK